MAGIMRLKRLKAGRASGLGNYQTPEAKRQTQELRQIILTRILTPEAKKRLDLIALADPTKGRLFEDVILKRSEMGLILTKVSCEDLIYLVETIELRAAPELEAIRHKRMQMQMQMAQLGSGVGQTPEQQNAREEAKRQLEELKQLSLNLILTTEAKERIARIALQKPNRARVVEDVILKNDGLGVILTKVSDKKLIELLEKMDHITTTETKATADPELEAIRRRRVQELMVQPGGGSVSDQKPISLPKKMDHIATTETKVTGGPELEAFVRRRMQEPMVEHGDGAAHCQTPEQQRAQEKAKRLAEELRYLNLTRFLTPDAKERLARIALVKPNKARLIEDAILEHAKMGHIRRKVSDEKLISSLELINTTFVKETKVRIKRRASCLDEE